MREGSRDAVEDVDISEISLDYDHSRHRVHGLQRELIHDRLQWCTCLPQVSASRYIRGEAYLEVHGNHCASFPSLHMLHGHLQYLELGQEQLLFGTDLGPPSRGTPEVDHTRSWPGRQGEVTDPGPT